MKNFKIWLEGNITGQVFYHGTSQEFNDFDLSHVGQRDYGDYGYGIYLTPSETLARMYAYDSVKRQGGTPIILRVRVMANNPANLDDPELENQVMTNTTVPFPKILTPGQPQTRPKQDAEKIRDYLISQGFDSVVARNGKEVVIFDPRNVQILGKMEDQ